MADQEPAATPDPVEPQGTGAPEPTAETNGGEEALTAAQQVVEDISREVAGVTGGEGSSLELPSFPDHAGGIAAETIDLLSDVSLNVKIELGRTSMLLEDVLKLGEGAVVELDKLAGDPVDIYVNNRPVARGEVLVVNDNFCVRVHEILSESGQPKAPASRGSR